MLDERRKVGNNRILRVVLSFFDRIPTRMQAPESRDIRVEAADKTRGILRGSQSDRSGG